MSGRPRRAHLQASRRRATVRRLLPRCQHPRGFRAWAVRHECRAIGLTGNQWVLKASELGHCAVQRRQSKLTAPSPDIRILVARCGRHCMMRHACPRALQQTPGVHALWQPLRGHAVASEAHCHAACRAGAAKVPPTEASRLFSSVLDGSGPHPAAHSTLARTHARTHTSSTASSCTRASRTECA